MLLGNQSTLMKCPVRFMAGTASSVEPQLRSNWNQAGRNRNKIYRDQRDADELYGIAPGLYAGYTWMIPQRNGAMASHDNAVFGMTGTGTLYGGVTATAPATFGISTNTPAGELVVTVQPGAAPSTFGFTTNTPELTASISGDGTSTFGFSTNTPILGAIASLTITPTSFGFDGTLTAYAIGIMEGTTAEAGVTVDNIVTALEAAILPVNIVKVNDYTVTGNGQTGSEWGP
jgi:hypothetical protein